MEDNTKEDAYPPLLCTSNMCGGGDEGKRCNQWHYSMEKQSEGYDLFKGCDPFYNRIHIKTFTWDERELCIEMLSGLRESK